MTTITLSADDEPMQRARHVFMMMGMGIRADEIGELMLRRAADVMNSYRALDRAVSPPAGYDPATDDPRRKPVPPYTRPNKEWP